MPDDEYLTTPQPAELIGYAVITLEAWRSKGIGPPYIRVMGKLIRYRQSDVKRWMEGQVEQTGEKRVADPRKRHRRRLRLKTD